MLRAALSRLRVNELRVLLTQAGLATDGEKEILVDRLTSYGRGFGFTDTHRLYEHLHAQEVPLQPTSAQKPQNALHLVTSARSARRLVVWEIQKYSSLTQGPGEALRSPRFTVASEWELSLFPAGLSNHSRHYTALMLNSLRTADAGESVRFKAAVVGPPPAHERFEVQSIVELIQPKETRGFSKLLETREIKQYLSADDTLRLECEVEEFSSWRTTTRLSGSTSSLECGRCSGSCTCAPSEPFAALLPESSNGFGSFADMELLCEGARLSAHRCVLAARSPVFAAMLRCDMREARERVVELKDVRLPVLRTMLRYMYTGRCQLQLPSAEQPVPAPGAQRPSAESSAGSFEEGVQAAAEVLAAADMYELTGLKAACERQLAGALAVSPDLCLAILQLADAHSLANLRATALECVVANAASLLTAPAFADVCRSAPALVLDINRALLLAGTSAPAQLPISVTSSSYVSAPAGTVPTPATAPAGSQPLAVTAGTGLTWLVPAPKVQHVPDRRSCPTTKRRRASVSH